MHIWLQLSTCNVDIIFKVVNIIELQTIIYQSRIVFGVLVFSNSSGGVHRGNPLATEWMSSGHYSRLDQELKPILAKVENQQEEYSSKYATNVFNEVSKYIYVHAVKMYLHISSVYQAYLKRYFYLPGVSFVNSFFKEFNKESISRNSCGEL